MPPPWSQGKAWSHSKSSSRAVSQPAAPQLQLRCHKRGCGARLGCGMGRPGQGIPGDSGAVETHSTRPCVHPWGWEHQNSPSHPPRAGHAQPAPPWHLGSFVRPEQGPHSGNSVILLPFQFFLQVSISVSVCKDMKSVSSKKFKNPPKLVRGSRLFLVCLGFFSLSLILMSRPLTTKRISFIM